MTIAIPQHEAIRLLQQSRLAAPESKAQASTYLTAGQTVPESVQTLISSATEWTALAVRAMIANSDCMGALSKAADRIRQASAVIAAFDGQPAAGSSKTVVVKPRETLGAIAQRELGKASRYMEIYNANVQTFVNGGSANNPDRIIPGWTLTIPGAQGGSLNLGFLKAGLNDTAKEFARTVRQNLTAQDQNDLANTFAAYNL